MNYPEHVKMYEVGPRDGLQNESQPIDAGVKIALINQLSESGLTDIEATAFVSPKWVPQMADAPTVMAGIQRAPGSYYPVLTPNIKGLERAAEAGADTVCLFAAATEAFSQKNTNCSIEESLERAAIVADAALKQDIRVRGYISCVLGCPYEGQVSPGAVANVGRRLAEMGCYEISLGDTVGYGNPKAAQDMVSAMAEHVPVSILAAHFHDTYGQALANILAVLQQGVATVDSAVGGLGGCPYAKGAKGNVATEDVLYMLDGMGIQTGVDLDKIVDIAWDISKQLGRRPNSRVAQAIGAKRNLDAA